MQILKILQTSEREEKERDNINPSLQAGNQMNLW